MKFSLRTPLSSSYKKYIAVAALALLLSILGLFKYQHARAVSQTVIGGLEVSRAPNPSQFSASVQDKTYLELAQRGPWNTLYSPEVWTKVYFDPNRKNDAVVGVFDGLYTGCGVDFNGAHSTNKSAASSCVNEQDAVQYEFYAATDIKPDPKNPNPQVSGFVDEGHCSVPFATINSSKMTSQGWYTIALTNKSAKYNKSYLEVGCDGGAIKPTEKTGKTVVFIRATWKPGQENNSEGRINAFRVGGAYTDGESPANALTGYWSPYETSTSSSPADTGDQSTHKLPLGEYAIQDRVSDLENQANYSFSFGPDCYLKKDQVDPRTRYIKWYDVDYSTDASKSFYNGLEAPYFELADITTGDNVTLTAMDGRQFTRVSGADLGGPNTFMQMKFTGQGGHIYAWRWQNVVRKDGIVFWMPYDDFPALNKGCGTYDQKIGLYAGRNNAGYTQGPASLQVTGGDTVNFLVDEQYIKGSAAAPQTTSHQNLVGQRKNPAAPPTWEFADALQDPAQGSGISDDGVWNGRAAATWVLPGMGPDAPYQPRRWLLFSYQVKNDAKNGASYCVTADMSPASSDKPTDTLTSNKVCFVVNNSLRPYLDTSGGDVHAGSAADCIMTPPAVGNGKIYGPPTNGLNLGSSGSYIVSAGDAINGFGSGGSASGDSLTFGKGGKYGPMCRPPLSDLLKDIESAKKDKQHPAQVIPGDGKDIDLGALKAGTHYVVEAKGNVAVHGLSYAPVTIVAGGTITVKPGSDGIVGAKRSFATSRENLPVVGMIGHDIEVEPGVTELNAALYAVANINTCNVGAWQASGYKQCNSKLIIRGFAMAHDFSFRRISAAKAGLALGEQIDYGAAFYLNPPPGFRVAGEALKYLGERAPLY